MFYRASFRMLSSVVLLLCIVAFAGFLTSPASAASTRAASSCPVQISAGSSGSLVKSLQQTLNADYQASVNAQANHQYQNIIFLDNPYEFYPLLSVDGQFGQLTTNAVKDFQTYKGLSVDGIVGPQTWHALGYC